MVATAYDAKTLLKVALIKHPHFPSSADPTKTLSCVPRPPSLSPNLRTRQSFEDACTIRPESSAPPPGGTFYLQERLRCVPDSAGNLQRPISDTSHPPGACDVVQIVHETYWSYFKRSKSTGALAKHGNRLFRFTLPDSGLEPALRQATAADPTSGLGKS
ncbi:uncharacterized protein BT62DRAFT_1078542 [Guyanagaster necrorhizus]|uniref:Uncharacterized protein n=1 Tax=Guyanagaster necrorhizus TaxID=856835 RepID=A0A9P8AQ56_9AGAR|nr:uncharacterized protein BT62DRAFT_1078542 [Guyanagaster necrorhizus MCA 3950]KAG7443481.1 hypothetical protein BT62DRAFT_1078542 [Guyanagaster necrorhizus MCA 3950]